MPWTTFLEVWVRRRRIVFFFALLMLGAIPLYNSIENPRLSGMLAVDRVQLIASGLCFGVALGVLMGARKFPGER
jgi:hypothetical protein